MKKKDDIKSLLMGTKNKSEEENMSYERRDEKG